MGNKYYLKENVKCEPLICQWYAWTQLLSPITFGANFANKFIKIMESYVASPEVHSMAAKNPNLLGGSFVDLEGKYVEEVQKLIAEIKTGCQTNFELIRQYESFDNYLQEHAKGLSLEECYQELPDLLKGMVELVYDAHNHPFIRLIEPLLYKKYYSSKYQKIMLSTITSDDRPFVMSTPWVDTREKLQLDIPFHDSVLDELFSSRDCGVNLENLMNKMNLSCDQEVFFRQLFTERKEKNSNNNFLKEGLRIRYFGHACVLLQTKDVSILVDPLISYQYDSEVSRFTLGDLPDEIDYVLVTHNHQDHVLLETLLQIRYKIKQIIVPDNNKGFLLDPSLKLALNSIGFKNVKTFSELDEEIIPGGHILSLPFLGEHCDLNIHSKTSYCVSLLGKKIIFAADSNNLDSMLYTNIFEITGKIDFLFLGMECVGAPMNWLYGPLFGSQRIPKEISGSRRLDGSNFVKAWDIVRQAQCENVFIYAMGQEPWLKYIMTVDYSNQSPPIVESNKLIAACEEKGIYAERLYGKKELIVCEAQQNSELMA